MLESISGSSLIFNLANIPLYTTRALNLFHYQHNGSHWDTLELDEVLTVLYARDMDNLPTILADLQSTSPDLSEEDLLAVLLGYVTMWTVSGRVQVITADGLTLVNDSVANSDVALQYDWGWCPSDFAN